MSIGIGLNMFFAEYHFLYNGEREIKSRYTNNWTRA